MVLQRADRLDEPAVVRSASGGGHGRVEFPAGVRLDGLLGGHSITVLLVAPDGLPGVANGWLRRRLLAEHRMGDACERGGDLLRRQAAGTLVYIDLGGNRCQQCVDHCIWIGSTSVDEK